MNIYEFIWQGGVVKTQFGARVTNIYQKTNPENEYVLAGKVHWPSDHTTTHSWNVDGIVEGLPTNYGIHLCPTVPITIHKMVSRFALPNYETIEQFYKDNE